AVVSKPGWSVYYTPSYICALNGSTVTMGCSYTYPYDYTLQRVFWSRKLVTNKEPPDLSLDPQYRGRVQYLRDTQSDCSLRLSDVTEQDQGKYYFRFITHGEKYQGRDGVDIFVTELQVEMIPDSVVEGDDVTLTCKTTCRRTVTPTFTWYKTGHSLPFISSSNPLRLQSVSQRDAGSYSCAVQGESYRSPAVTLDVQWNRSVVLYVVLAIAGGCGCLFAIIAVLCIRRKRRRGSDDVAMSGQKHHQCPPDDTYTSLDLQTRSSSDVYHTLANVNSSPPDDTYTSLDFQSVSPDYDTLT
ncbi:B-cell receptor CD22-like isoform X1, partial [Clarias magur]